MKVLVVVDAEEYSLQAARIAARFAINTWADVTILALQAKNEDAPNAKLPDALSKIQCLFLGNDSPYGTYKENAAFHPIKNNAWEMDQAGSNGRKQFRVLIRQGDWLRIVSEQVEQEQADFLILGASASSTSNNSEWDCQLRFPHKVAASAPCSSLVIKGTSMGKTLVCCLDQASVSQESLEIINQLVTIQEAELKIVGLTGPHGLREKVEERMMQVLRYYTERGVRAWVRLVDEEELPVFAHEASKTGTIGLWLGKKSLLTKFFSKDRLEQLITASESSVVILK